MSAGRIEGPKVLLSTETVRLVEVPWEYEDGTWEQDKNPFDLTKDKDHPRVVRLEVAGGKDLVGATRWKELRLGYGDDPVSAADFKAVVAALIKALDNAGGLT